jgi:glutamate synthase (NADPH/NADH) small chain
VEFIPLTNPVKFIGDERKFVKTVECVRMALGKLDNSGRRRTHEIAGSNYMIDADMVILALGLRPNPVLPSLTSGLDSDSRGYITIGKNYMTSISGIFAGGDIVGGGSVIEAMGMGKKAARAIVEYLKNHE